jgi:hypothetical protein
VMGKIILFFFLTVSAFGQGLSLRDPYWRVVKIPGALADRPAACQPKRDVYVCIGAGCTAGGAIHYCTATNTWT